MLVDTLFGGITARRLYYSDKEEALSDYAFFHKLGMSVTLTAEKTKCSSTTRTLKSDWNRELTGL